MKFVHINSDHYVNVNDVSSLYVSLDAVAGYQIKVVMKNGDKWTASGGYKDHSVALNTLRDLATRLNRI